MEAKIIKRKCLLDDFFKVDELIVQHQKFSGGWSKEVRRLNLERGESVAVLIYLEDKDHFVLVRQFRIAVYETGGSGWIEEIVAGVLDEDNPLECAKRECIEEAGYEIEKFEYVGHIYSSPGITTESVHLYIGYCKSVDQKHPGGGLVHEHEDIEIVEISTEKALENLNNGYYHDGKTILALSYFFLNWLK
jgi:ADP-ribose pyrophosphatase